MQPSRSRSLLAAATLAATAAGLVGPVHAAPVPVVDRGPEAPNKSGVDNVRVVELGGGYAMSGSSQFTTDGLDELVGLLGSGGYDPDKHHLVIVDLRQEAHGFVHDHAVRWMESSDPDLIKYDWVNLGRSHDDVIRDEKTWLANAAEGGPFYLHPKGPTLTKFEFLNSQPYVAMTEAELVEKKLGADHYVRLTVPDHKKPESDAEVDLFLKELERLYAVAAQRGRIPWFHFHCAAGQGRTTTFMSLYDFYVQTRIRKVELPFERDGGVTFDKLEDHVRRSRQCATMIKKGKGGADITYSTALDILLGKNEHTQDEPKGWAGMDRFNFVVAWYFYLRSPYTRSWHDHAVAGECSLDDFKAGREGKYLGCL